MESMRDTFFLPSSFSENHLFFRMVHTQNCAKKAIYLVLSVKLVFVILEGNAILKWFSTFVILR